MTAVGVRLRAGLRWMVMLFQSLLTWERRSMVKTAETPMNLWTHADTFRKAAHILRGEVSPVPAGAILPAYYVACHGLELAMKAFLRARGFDDRRLRNLGHDLRRCLKRADASGFSAFVKLDSDETDAITWISPQYRAKELEYVVTQGFKALPDMKHLVSALDKILAGIRHECFQATVRERGLPRA